MRHKITVLIAAIAVLAFAGQAQATQQLSPTAVRLAVQFWQPYSSTPVCPDGVDVHYVGRYGDAGSVPSLAYTRRVNGEFAPNCNVFADPTMLEQPRAMQCAFVARALGIAWFGLSPSSDRRNIMYGPAWVIPAACNPV